MRSKPAPMSAEPQGQDGSCQQGARDGSIYVDQGMVAGCSGGTYENLCAVADILRGKSCGNGDV